VRARKKIKCPDCGNAVKRKSTSQWWDCLRCHAHGTFLEGKAVVRSRYVTFSNGRGWRLNPWHPESNSILTRMRARVAGA
jgi:hypothetical protein